MSQWSVVSGILTSTPRPLLRPSRSAEDNVVSRDLIKEHLTCTFLHISSVPLCLARRDLSLICRISLIANDKSFASSPAWPPPALCSWRYRLVFVRACLQPAVDVTMESSIRYRLLLPLSLLKPQRFCSVDPQLGYHATCEATVTGITSWPIRSPPLQALRA